MKISNAALAQLDSLEIGPPSDRWPWYARITAQLDRELRREAIAILKTAGGRRGWKTEAYLFQHDPRPHFETMMLEGVLSSVSKSVDHISTPAPLAREIVRLANIKTGQQVLEPSAGDGAIIREIVALNLPSLFLWAVEIRPERRDEIEDVLQRPWLQGRIDGGIAITDFMTWDPPIPHFDRVVMNPPFARLADANHVLRAYSLLKPGGRLVSIVSAGAMFRTVPAARQLQALVESNGYAQDNDPDAFSASGTRVRTVTIGITKPYGARP